jgi:hypothetical protein
MDERAWTDEVLEQVPTGIDGTQIEERLRLTPTERLERMRQFLVGLQAARGAPWSPTSSASSRP